MGEVETEGESVLPFVQGAKVLVMVWVKVQRLAMRCVALSKWRFVLKDSNK